MRVFVLQKHADRLGVNAGDSKTRHISLGTDHACMKINATRC